MHDGWLGFCGMEDCFMGLRASGGGFTSGGLLTNYSAIVSSSMLNSSSSSSTLSLGFCRMVCSISVLIGWMVGFLDRSPCMNWTKFCSYSGFSTAVWMVSGTTLDRTALNRTRPALDRSNRDYTTAKLEQHRKKENKNLFSVFYFI
jgi:hypothetical protein